MKEKRGGLDLEQERLLQKLDEAARLGQIPELQDLQMHDRFRDIPPQQKIPDSIYCGIASVLGFLIDLEEGAAPRKPGR